MKQTPEIVIPPKQINACVDCPYFDEVEVGLYAYGCGVPDTYCLHPLGRKYGEKMNEGKFETIPGTEIWINCPLPDTETNEKT